MKSIVGRQEQVAVDVLSGDVFDDHGSAAYSSALLMVGDVDRAGEIVVRLIADFCSITHESDSVCGRQDLSRELYFRCMAATRNPRVRLKIPRRVRGQRSIVVQLGALSDEQRAAIALCMYGDHTYRQVAELMSLPAPVVASLLKSGLQRLSP